MQQIEITKGKLRAVFHNPDGSGWIPDWFYENERPMLRFKDHEWMTFGHAWHPKKAETFTRTDDGGAEFRGSTIFGTTSIAWCVRILPDPSGPGFVVECEFTPEKSIELLEAYTTLETAYDYDGTETVTTVIGMNPVSHWEGNKRITPPIWENPAWVYARPQSARITAPCNAPFICQRITDAAGVPDRYVTVIGDWSVCKIHDVYAGPTRNTPADPPSLFVRYSDLKGYKYIVGALNWSSAYAKDPNVLFPGGETARQRMLVNFSTDMPTEHFDGMLLKAWERSALLELPEDGLIEAFDRATKRGVSWSAATEWVRDAFCKDDITKGFVDPENGISTYAFGTRPKVSDSTSWSWWSQWAGFLHYRARLKDDAKLRAVCDRFDLVYLKESTDEDPFGNDSIAEKVTSLPGIWWACTADPKGPLAEAFKRILHRTTEMSVNENGKVRKFDFGAQAAIAEALLLGAGAFDDNAMRDQALLLLREMEERLDGEFWRFNVSWSDSLVHGGQIRSLGHGHAVIANLLAARQTGEKKFLLNARRFARYLLSINYANHNGSHDPDFDWRGWCNGSNAGRDQIAEFPPYETQCGLLCASALMAEVHLESGFYDALWYIARTGLAQFPAARTLKRVLDQHMQAQFIPRSEIASEQDFYEILPYLAYENPHDQTMLAPYQGTDCLMGELVYGGGLGTTSDPRLGTVVPRAATFDLRELQERLVHVWNPTASPIDSELTVTWPDGAQTRRSVSVPPRKPLILTIKRTG